MQEDQEIIQVIDALKRYLPNQPTKVNIMARQINDLKEQMRDDIVHFVFRKMDGSERHAYGTRASDVIAAYDNHTASVGKKAARKVAFGTFSYFDIERNDWRCFRVDRLLDIKNDYTI